MTYKPLTENLGEELLTLYLEGFHAKTSPQLEREKGLTENGQECGEKWHASFTKYDLDLSLWKTHQCSLLGDLDEFSETWPRWGLMRNGECWEQQTLAHRTNGTEFGLSERLPTPQASDYITKKTSASWKAKGGVNFSLSNPDIQAKWPTPCLPGNGGTNGKAKLKKMLMLPTPTASMMPCEGTVRIMRKVWELGEMSLEEASAIAGRDVRKAQGKVKAWPTPVKSDYAARRPSEGWRGESDLPSVVWTETGGRENPEKPPAQLNADWVEWLMGWPLGWTDLKPLETDKFQRWLDAHGKS
jgi:hypothetical protein